jgi:hypothetical protein
MGAWFLGTFVFSIPAFLFYDPLLNHAGYVVGDGKDAQVAVGALLEILLAISGIATAVVIFPIVKRVNESLALGYVASRTVESILILVGVLSLMSVVALRQVLPRPAIAALWLKLPVDCSPCMTRHPFSVRSSAPGSGTGFSWAT